MEDLKSRLLNYLKEFKSERVVFKIDDALERLRVSRRELEEALFMLEDEGYLTILKIPPSDSVVNRLKSRLNELDASFIMGLITETEYSKKWREIVDVTSPDATKDLEPLPSQNLTDLLKAFRTECDRLEKLREEKGKVDDKVYSELLKVYTGIFLKVGNALKNYARALITALRMIRDELERLRVSSEALELDSRIRGVNHRAELEDLEKKSRELAQRILRLASKAGFPQQPDAIAKEREALLKKLVDELNQAEKSLQIFKAKALIEGEGKYRIEIARLEKMIQELRGRVEALGNELKTPEAGENLLKELESLHDRLSSLSMDGINEETRRSIGEALDLIGAGLRVLQKLTGEIREERPALYNIPRLLEILRELPS
ncbi:MAG: hypothetical protein QXF90_02195 [Thermofilaceae archaeon]